MSLTHVYIYIYIHNVCICIYIYIYIYTYIYTYIQILHSGNHNSEIPDENETGQGVIPEIPDEIPEVRRTIPVKNARDMI